MKDIITPSPKSDRVFRLAYASRAKTDMKRDSVEDLAANAAMNNSQNSVSGVLFSESGIFLQWLEGPARDVCSLMSRISEDERHEDVTVLSAGWITDRRFADWPMQLTEEHLEIGESRPTGSFKRGTPYDANSAMIAFDRAANVYRHEVPADGHLASDYAGFARRLIEGEANGLPELPRFAQTDLRQRAQWVDEICATFEQGWQDDIWSSTEIALGQAHLNSLWQRAGRPADPITTRSRIAIIIPPGSHEILGAVVKSDLLRAAGFAVDMILERDTKTALAALSSADANAVIVSGPRADQSRDAERAIAFAKTIEARFPKLPVHLGGRMSGSICDWPDRLAWRRDVTNGLPATDVEWLAMAALAAVTKGEKSLSIPQRDARRGQSLH